MRTDESDSEEPLLGKVQGLSNNASSPIALRMPPHSIKDYGYRDDGKGVLGGGTARVWATIIVAVPLTCGGIFYNKWLLTEAPFPFLVTVFQLFTLLICTQVARHTTSLFSRGSEGVRDLKWAVYLLKMAFISLIFYFEILLGNTALVLLPISLTRMLPSCQLGFFTLGMVLLGYEESTGSAALHITVSFAALTLICLASLTAENALGAVAQVGWSVLSSITCLFSATLLAGVQQTQAGRGGIISAGMGSHDSRGTGFLLGPQSLTLPVVVCHVTPMAFLYALVMFMMYESSSVNWDQVYEVGIPAFLVNGFFYFALLLIGSVVALVSPLPVISLTSASVDGLVVLGGVTIMGEHLGWGAIVGMIIAWANSFLYRRSREKPSIPRPIGGGSVRYSKGEWISYERIPEMAETGDLILFTTTPSLTAKGLGSAAVRLGTFSSIDHVGLVIKTPEGETCLIEALAEGVSVSEWHHFMDQGWHEDYSRIVLRRLNWPARRRGMRGGRLEEFAATVRGKSYGLNVCGLLCGNGSVRDWDDPLRTFFCSEVVAEGYKYLGLLPAKSCAARYVPGSFAEGSFLELPEGVSLSPEYKIYFPGRWHGFEDAAAFVLRSF